MHASPLAWIAFASAVIAAAIMVNYLVRKPQLTGPVKATLILGIGVLPIITAMVGNMEGLASTEEQEFCGSCHTMDRHIEDANEDAAREEAIRRTEDFFRRMGCPVRLSDVAPVKVVPADIVAHLERAGQTKLGEAADIDTAAVEAILARAA